MLYRVAPPPDKAVHRLTAPAGGEEQSNMALNLKAQGFVCRVAEEGHSLRLPSVPSTISGRPVAYAFGHRTPDSKWWRPWGFRLA
jgi:hypothetical protein